MIITPCQAKDTYTMMYDNILSAIGHTPLVNVDLGCKAHIFAKLEYLNPGGSVKDRSAHFMIEHAEKKGLLKPGGTIVDASSGNHGIAIAMIGAVKKYHVIITVTEKISTEKLQTLKAYGAEIVMCSSKHPLDHPESYHSTALKIHKKTPNSFMPNQYYNIENRHAHYSLIGPEIWDQTNGKVTHVIAAAGTGGTISGAGTYLKEKNPDVKVIAVDSENSLRATNGCPRPYKIEGMGIDFVSPVLDYDIVDEFVCVSDEEALRTLKPFAQNEGLLVGLSSGAVIAATQKYSYHFKDDNCVVMICGDSGRAYLTKHSYE
jgi:cystathionine beta-synthase